MNLFVKGGLWMLLLSPFLASAQFPCIDGLAGGYECDHVDLIAHITPAELGGATTNEVWGWTDPLDSKEYVVLGVSTGVYFFDISEPVTPILLGNLPTHTVNSPWRTFRIYQDFLFVCSEANDHGMQVFDLTRLRNVVSPPEIFTEDAHYDLFGDCHTLAICEETGMAYACGTNTYNGSVHIVNIQNPLNPQIAGGYVANGYTHEAQVILYDGPDPDYIGRTIAFCYNGNSELPLTIVDVTNPDDAITISLSTYPGKRYCHQGWLTEDNRYLLLNDELDEYYDFADSLHSIIFDVNDLDAPVYMGYHAQGTAIDHNTYIKGNLAYMSHYTDGLNIMDVSEVSDTVITRVAYFDHYQNGDPELFEGEWLNYPYFSSGIVPVTDIYNGLFLLRPNFIRANTPEWACSHDGFEVNVELFEGFEGPYLISFNGLPFGVMPQIPDEIGLAPSNFLIGFSGTESLSGNVNFELIIQGQSHIYSAMINLEILPSHLMFTDDDNDGYGNVNSGTVTCISEPGWVFVSGDCDDDDPTIYENALGTNDGVDNDCNGLIENDEILCADFNNDGIVTSTDINIFIGNYDCQSTVCIGDLDNDGFTSISDLIILMAQFGQYCP